MKKIGITQRVIEAQVGAKRDGLEQDYVQYYEKFPIALIPIPNVINNLEAHIEVLSLDGIILSGGNDINPKMYGRMPDSNGKYADERDKTERKLVEYAMKTRMPIFAECRGTQFLNVFFGGRIVNVMGHVAQNHEVDLDSEFFREKKIETNSFHNSGFTEKELGNNLKGFAKCADDVIEGIFHVEFPFAGVLWHPERKSKNDEFNKKLVNAFLNREWFFKP